MADQETGFHQDPAGAVAVHGIDAEILDEHRGFREGVAIGIGGDGRGARAARPS